jgi:hypothetical protein
VIQTAKGMHEAVFHKVLRRSQGLAIATHHFGGAPAQAVQIAAEDAVPVAAMDEDAAAGEAFHRAAGHEAAFAILERHAISAGKIEDQTLQSHLRHLALA